MVAPKVTAKTSPHETCALPLRRLPHDLVRPFLPFYLRLGSRFNRGAIRLSAMVGDALSGTFPDEAQWFLEHWGKPYQPTERLSHWPTDATSSARPISCHSHNDYWRKVPLFSAIRAGCTSVEADVWLFNHEVYVGHTKSSLTPDRTLRALYLDPLTELLQKRNRRTEFRQDDNLPEGVFEVDPSQTLVLLLDFKTSGAELWPEILAQLSPLRDRGYLTHFNGTDIVQRPITVVGSGKAPFDLITANTTYRDFFYDAPLDRFVDVSADWPNPNRIADDTKPGNNALLFNQGVAGLRPAGAADEAEDQDRDASITNQGLEQYGPHNSYYASVSFTHSIGFVWGSRLSQAQLQLLRAQIRGAHQRGLRVRYWDLPYWPAGLRNHIWHILIREGIDVLSVDDLIGATRWDWRKRKGWWF